MSRFGKTIFLTLITMLTILLSSCGAKSTDNSIATAVALTVAAQNAAATIPAATETPVPQAGAFPTKTPLQFAPTLTQLAPVASPTRQANTASSECAKASLVSETIPDGTIYAPGAQFTKTWEIKNLSTCTWDTSYKIVFWDGNIMGGGYVYNLPQIVPPQGTVPISLVLTAPDTEDTYTSKWALQTPDGYNFGVGEYSVPFSVQIIVSAAQNPVYTVTSVDYSIVRTPSSGCPANVTYTAYAKITTNGPMDIKYRWYHSDGGGSATGHLTFDAAGVQTVSDIWKLHLGSSPNDHRWFWLVIVDPAYQDFSPGINFAYTCK